MTQLWLDGRRIDSIPLLRRFLSECRDEEALIRILCELIRKYQNGVLSPWLSRQTEAQPQSALAIAMGGECSLLSSLWTQACKLENALPALAELCAQEESHREKYLTLLKGILEEQPLDTMQVNSDKQQLIQNQQWYRSLHKLFEHIDWNNVATDTESLLAILERIQEEHHSGQAAIYLCNTGNRFRINQPLQLSRIRLIGCGNPSVYIASHNRNKTLDMKKQNLSFESFTLYAQGMVLAGVDRLKDVEVN